MPYQNLKKTGENQAKFMGVAVQNNSSGNG
jgi:hypothetical protein